MSRAKAELERLLDAEVDKRFETEILDRLRGKRLSPLAVRAEQKEEGGADGNEEGMTDEELAMLQALDQGDNAEA